LLHIIILNSLIHNGIIHYHPNKVQHTRQKTKTTQHNKRRRQGNEDTKPFTTYIYTSPFSSFLTISNYIMMIYQQSMLSSTFEPVSSHRSSLSSSFIERRKISSSSSSQEQQQPQKPHQEQQRSVNFSSCTKSQEAQEQQTGVKRMSSSSSVPIPESCMFRTPSELQLTVDEQVADQRDFAFFARLVNGISERRGSSSSAIETDRCLTHIIQTRHHQQSHDDDQEEEGAQHCDGILIEDDYQVGTGGEGAYYLGEDNDCFTSSSSSSSSSLYQHEFVDYEDDEAHTATHSSNNDDDLYNEGGDCECMFDLEL